MGDIRAGVKLYCNVCHHKTPHIMVRDKEEDIIYAYCACGNLKIIDNW